MLIVALLEMYVLVVSVQVKRREIEQILRSRNCGDKAFEQDLRLLEEGVSVVTLD